MSCRRKIIIQLPGEEPPVYPPDPPVPEAVAYTPNFGICQCGRPGQEPHTCPYAEEIGGDSTSTCNCCEECYRQCL